MKLILILVAAFSVLGVYSLAIELAHPTDYTLKNYTGVGSGVYKHGTIVKVVNGQPVVVGHFDDDTGKNYPGTMQIEEVKR